MEQYIEVSKHFIETKSMRSLKKLYKQYYKSLCFFAYEHLKDKESAKDQVQDVFVDLLEKDLNIDNATKLKGYLYSMVRNRCLNVMRAEGVRRKYIDSELFSVGYEDDAGHMIIKSEVYREINLSLQKIPDKYREVFELSYLKQMREAEIALRLNISVDTVKSRKKMAKKMLRKELKYLFILLLILKI